MRRRDGSINQDLRSQRSIHLLAGLARDFKWTRISDKPFRFIAETYYKKFIDLVSYDIDNVRLRYAGENDASGYAMGLDMRLNGEFVKGAESWINVSFLKTRESIDGIEHQAFSSESGQFETVSSVARPTDQSFHISIFFQDYLPRNENIKVNLNLIYGSGIPFGLPENNTVIRNTFRYSAYRRVDMGFAWQIWNEKRRNEKSRHIFRNFKNAWLTLEVFNLIGIENVSSNTWIKSIGDQYFAVPNKLTTRRLNLRWRMEF
jgi:hypothetical protein